MASRCFNLSNLSNSTRLLLLLLLSSPPFVIATPSTPQQLQQLRGKIDTLRNDLTSDADQQIELQITLQQTEKAISAVQRQLRTLRVKLKKQRQHQRQLQQQTAQLKKALERHRLALRQQLVSRYMVGQETTLKLLLNQSDPNRVGRMLVYHDYFTQAQLKTIGATRDTVVKLEKSEYELDTQSLRLQRLEKEQKQREQQLKKERSKRQKVLASLNTHIDSKEQQLKQLLADEAQLQQLLKKITRRASQSQQRTKIFSQLKGELSWPTHGKITHNYGSLRNQGPMKWQGVVIGAEEGQEVHASASGKIAYADWIRGYGLIVIIDHGEGFMTLYGHNQSLYKERGEQVSANEVIATVGSSGGQKKTGLYFELRKEGRAVNPAAWLKR